MNESPKPSEILIMAGGVVLFIASFLDWITFDAGGFGDVGFSGWDELLFPIAPIVAVLALAAGVLVALDRFANTNLPDDVAGFTWPQIYLAIGVFAVLVTLSFIILDKGGGSAGIGLWGGLLGAVGVLVGAVMMRNEVGAGPARPAGPPQSF